MRGNLDVDQRDIEPFALQPLQRGNAIGDEHRVGLHTWPGQLPQDGLVGQSCPRPRECGQPPQVGGGWQGAGPSPPQSGLWRAGSPGPSPPPPPWPVRHRKRPPRNLRRTVPSRMRSTPSPAARPRPEAAGVDPRARPDLKHIGGGGSPDHHPAPRCRGRSAPDKKKIVPRSASASPGAGRAAWRIAFDTRFPMIPVQHDLIGLHPGSGSGPAAALKVGKNSHRPLCARRDQRRSWRGKAFLQHEGDFLGRAGFSRYQPAAGHESPPVEPARTGVSAAACPIGSTLQRASGVSRSRVDETQSRR